MSLDVQSDLNPQARVAENTPEAQQVSEQLESVFFVLASGLAVLLISAIWVSLSLG
jgi:hypothetical protein